MPTLFRQQAIEYATRRLAGDVVLATPISLRIYVYLVCAVALFGALFATFASYSRQEEVIGWLIPRGGIIRIAARSGGTVERLLVKEGDFVRAGAPIVEIRSSTAVSGGEDAGEAQSKALAAEAHAAQEHTDAAVQKLLTEQAFLGPKLNQIKAQIEEGNHQIAAQREQIKIAQLDLARYERMYAEHAISDREVQGRRSALLGTQQTLSQLRASVFALRQQVFEADARLKSIPADITVARAANQTSWAQIAQKEIEVRAQGKDLVLASISGRVQALPVDLGQSVAAGATVAIITPKGAHLEAELYASSRAVGFVRPGQTVHLMYQAFPHEKFGAQPAAIISISRTILSPSEVQIPGINVQQPVFRVRAAIAAQGIEAYGQYVPLQPGMLLNASIIFDRRSLLQWLFDPIYAARK